MDISNILPYSTKNSKENKNTTTFMEDISDSVEPQIYLSISSLVKNDISREIELNWYNVSENLSVHGTIYARLYSQNPNHNSNVYLEEVKINDFPEGTYKTKIQFPIQNFNSSYLASSVCLGYWGALVQNERIIATDCIKTQPRWMEDMKEKIKDKTLKELYIPGTHDAGTFIKYDKESYNLIAKYVYCQEEDFASQLIYGIRFFDIRVSYQSVRKQQEKFWVSHAFFRMDVPIKDALLTIKKFLDSTNEFVIMDFHRFNRGFNGHKNKKVHTLLMDMIEEYLGEYMIPSNLGYSTKLETLWKMNKRLYIGYADDIRIGRNKINKPVHHLWADTDKSEKLIEFLIKNACIERDSLKSGMVELTPKAMNILFNSYGGLRVLADKINRQISKLYREQISKCPQIIAADYFMGSQIISLAINFNKNL